MVDILQDQKADALPEPFGDGAAKAAGRITFKPRAAIASLLDGFSQTGRELLRRHLPFAVSGLKRDAPQPAEDILAELAQALLSVRGEASGVAIATDLLGLYGKADTAARYAFFTMLATQLNPNETALSACWERYCAEGVEALPALAQAVESPRQELFRRLNLAPGGTAALVRMRADLLTIMQTANGASFAVVDADLLHLLQSWFNRGFLSMRLIDWSSPASLLERIIRYEAVHDISSWAELRRRLDPDDRRCFAFFHPAMHDEPLIFVEVALTTDIPDSIQALLDADRPMLSAADAKTAVFYSISNCQPGLKGISFGHFLIKQVATDLNRELPSLTTFVTLSPIPGLIRWLRSTADDAAMIDRLQAPPGDDPAQEAALADLVMQKAVTYFMEARTGSGKLVDPVARFHLGNGARLERLNWRADISPNGLPQSGGLMVNYLYDLPRIEEYHEAYANRTEIATGEPFRKMAKSLAYVRSKK